MIDGRKLLAVGILVGVSWMILPLWLSDFVIILLVLISLGLIFSGVYLEEAEK